MTTETNPAVLIEGLRKEYRGEGETVTVLDGLDLRIEPGTISSVEGKSGVGKSTLLNIIGTIDSHDAGSVRVFGRELSELDERSRELFRATVVGFIFQHHYLLPDFTIVENVMMPLLILRRPPREARAEAAEALGLVGLADRLEHYPGQVSGGEMARAGVARALVGNKQLILADEPTGNLDRANAERLVDLIWRLQAELSFTLLIVTHDRELAERVPNRYRLLAQRLESVR